MEAIKMLYKPGSQRNGPDIEAVDCRNSGAAAYTIAAAQELITNGQDKPRMHNLRHFLLRILVVFRGRHRCLPADVRNEMARQETNPFYTISDCTFELHGLFSQEFIENPSSLPNGVIVVPI